MADYGFPSLSVWLLMSKTKCYLRQQKQALNTTLTHGWSHFDHLGPIVVRQTHYISGVLHLLSLLRMYALFVPYYTLGCEPFVAVAKAQYINHYKQVCGNFVLVDLERKMDKEQNDFRFFLVTASLFMLNSSCSWVLHTNFIHFNNTNKL